MKKLLLLTALSISVYGKAQSCAGVVFTSGPNALGTGGSYSTYIQNCLSYNADLNTVLWTHRASPYWNFTGYTSGCIQSTWLNVSTNVWDSTIIYRDATTKHARYPGGTIFNPTGNTNIANALMVGTGPTNNGTNWTGTWYSSRQPTGSYHTVTSAQNDNAVCLSGQAPFGNMSGVANGDGGPNADIQQVGNTIFVGGGLVNYSYTASDAIPFKGGLIGKATYSGGNLTWSADSIIPNFYTGTLGYLNMGQTRIAFSPNGQIGYVIFIGRLASTFGNSSDSSLTPIIYKSTNGGATWSSAPVLSGFDWMVGHPEMKQSISYLYQGTPAGITPYSQLGIDVTVDSTGTLHLVAAVTNAKRFVTATIDSLAAYENIYQWDYRKHHPIIWDMMTDGTTWNTILVDSIKTSYIDSQTADTTSPANPWALAYGARIQVSRSTTGGKIFYSWTDSDTSQTHTLYNTNPDIYMKSYDISNQLVTPTNNVTTGLGKCFFHYLSDISYYDNNLSGWVCPLVYTTPVTPTPPFNQSDTVHYNYLNCANFHSSQYTTPASVYRTQVPSGIANYTNNNNLKIYPNPANNKITIDAVDVVDVKLFDVLGKEITSTKENNVDVSNFNDGVYFIQVQTKQNIYSQKIVVQH